MEDALEHTLIWEAVEVWGGWDAEPNGQGGALVGNDQVLVGPVMAGHLPKQQLLLRHCQAGLQGKALQGALHLLGAPACIHSLCTPLFLTLALCVGSGKRQSAKWCLNEGFLHCRILRHIRRNTRTF